MNSEIACVGHSLYHVTRVTGIMNLFDLIKRDNERHDGLNSKM